MGLICVVWSWVVWRSRSGSWLWGRLSCSRCCWLGTRACRLRSCCGRLGSRSCGLCWLSSRLSSCCCCWLRSYRSRLGLCWLRSSRCWSNSCSIWYLTRLSIRNSSGSSSIRSRNILNTSMSLLFFLIIIVIIVWFLDLFRLLWFWILLDRLLSLLRLDCFWRLLKFIFFNFIRFLLSSLFLIAY